MVDVTSLVRLSLSHIKEFSASTVCGFIKRNKALKSLSLCECDLSDTVIKDIADALKLNTTVTEVDLSMNKCRLEGALELSLMAKENRTLNTLDLSWNEIGQLGLMLIIAATVQNKGMNRFVVTF